MTTAVIFPYAVDAFNDIPDLQSSEQKFISCEGQKYVENGFAQLFNKHKMTQKFNLVLLHRHGRLLSEQAMVDTNGTSVPWTVKHTFEDGDDYPKWNGAIFPTSWLVRDGRLMPYEFSFSPQNTSGTTSSRLGVADIAFVLDFVDYIEKHNLGRLFGLSLWHDSQQKTLEITEGTANITFPLKDDKVLLDGSCVQAGWAFGLSSDEHVDNLPQPNGCHSWCVSGCLSRTHLSVHYRHQSWCVRYCVTRTHGAVHYTQSD